MHSYGTAALDHAQPADTHRQQNTICLTGAWSLPNFEWGSPNSCPPTNLKPGQAFLVGCTMFETDRLSPKRERRCNAMSECRLSSIDRFLQTLVSRQTSKPCSPTDKPTLKASVDGVCPQAVHEQDMMCNGVHGTTMMHTRLCLLTSLHTLPRPSHAYGCIQNFVYVQLGLTGCALARDDVYKH